MIYFDQPQNCNLEGLAKVTTLATVPCLFVILKPIRSQQLIKVQRYSFPVSTLLSLLKRPVLELQVRVCFWMLVVVLIKKLLKKKIIELIGIGRIIIKLYKYNLLCT